MARTLSALTTRGRSFIAAGVTAIACAVILGERDLLRAGVLVLALPLLSALVVSRTRYRLRCSRRASPPRLPTGHEVRIDLLLENASRLPTGILLVEDQVPYTLGGRPRFVVDRIEPHGGREMIYRLRAETRGRYLVGPLTVRLADPFGLVELVRSFSATDRVVVTPPIVPLPAGRLTGSWAGGGESRARALSTAGEDDVAPREYRHGDDLRRVHWRSTARHGELMVRREEQQWQSRGTVFLDTRRAAHWGDGPGSTFEQAVSAAASIGVRLGRDGLGLRFVTDEGEALGASGTFESELLDMLAVARMSSGRSLRPGVSALHDPAAGDGLVIGVFGPLTAADAREVSRARRGAATCVAVLIGAGGDAGTGAEAAAVLRGAGWRVLTVSSAAALAGAWLGAGGHGTVAEDPAPKHPVTKGAVTKGAVTNGQGGEGRGGREPAPADTAGAAPDPGATGAAQDGPERTEAP